MKSYAQPHIPVSFPFVSQAVLLLRTLSLRFVPLENEEKETASVKRDSKITPSILTMSFFPHRTSLSVFFPSLFFQFSAGGTSPYKQSCTSSIFLYFSLSFQRDEAQLPNSQAPIALPSLFLFTFRSSFPFHSSFLERTAAHASLK